MDLKQAAVAAQESIEIINQLADAEDFETIEDLNERLYDASGKMLKALGSNSDPRKLSLEGFCHLTNCFLVLAIAEAIPATAEQE